MASRAPKKIKIAPSIFGSQVKSSTFTYSLSPLCPSLDHITITICCVSVPSHPIPSAQKTRPQLPRGSFTNYKSAYLLTSQSRKNSPLSCSLSPKETITHLRPIKTKPKNTPKPLQKVSFALSYTYPSPHLSLYCVSLSFG